MKGWLIILSLQQQKYEAATNCKSIMGSYMGMAARVFLPLGEEKGHLLFGFLCTYIGLVWFVFQNIIFENFFLNFV